MGRWLNGAREWMLMRQQGCEMEQYSMIVHVLLSCPHTFHVRVIKRSLAGDPSRRSCSGSRAPTVNGGTAAYSATSFLLLGFD